MGRLITCPGHVLVYASQERLVSVGHATSAQDFNKNQRGLQPVCHIVWNGFGVVNLSGQVPLMPDLGRDALDNQLMARLVTGYRLERLLSCNWKVLSENYTECLHCPGIHPELCDRASVYSHGIMGLEEVSHPNERGTRLNAGAQGRTPTGAPCGEVYHRLTERQKLVGAMFLARWPSCYLVPHVDQVRAVRPEPVRPTQTRLAAKWYFTRKTLAQPGFDATKIAWFAHLVLDQDADAVEMNQRGLASPAFTAGQLMPHDNEIHRFHQGALTQIEAA